MAPDESWSNAPDAWRDDGSLDRVLIRVACTACGNATLESVDSGKQVPARFYVSRTQLAEMRADLPDMTCTICGGPMSIEEL